MREEDGEEIAPKKGFASREEERMMNPLVFQKGRNEIEEFLRGYGIWIKVKFPFSRPSLHKASGSSFQGELGIAIRATEVAIAETNEKLPFPHINPLSLNSRENLV